MSTVNFRGGNVPGEVVPAVKAKVANATEEFVSKPEIKAFPDMVADKAKNSQVKNRIESEYTSPFMPQKANKVQEANSVLARAAAEKAYNAPPTLPYN